MFATNGPPAKFAGALLHGGECRESGFFFFQVILQTDAEKFKPSVHYIYMTLDLTHGVKRLSAPYINIRLV